ncbi:MAG: DUF4037 domain-containing protein [Christensenellales bacterium]
MKGIELARKFYMEYGKSMLAQMDDDIVSKLCVGVVGSGSECYGYDDEVSQDHDFGPGFCIFVPDELDSRQIFALERAYCSLPREFEGYKRSIVCPVGGNRQGVLKISEFLAQKIGFDNADLTIQQWFYAPEYGLAECVNGEIFEDNCGLMTDVRNKLRYYPDDVRIKKLAGNLLIMAQAGQYNYYRCIKRKETGAAQLAVAEFVKSTMQTVFLLNRRYMPYYKWSFRAMKDLPELASLSKQAEYLLSSPNDEAETIKKQAVIEQICREVSTELQRQGLGEKDCYELERQAYAVNDKVKDNVIRTKNVLWAI